MIKLALYLFDVLEDGGRKPIIARETEVPKTIDLFQLPELAAFVGTEILMLDLLTNLEEEIKNEITTKVGSFKEMNATFPAIYPQDENAS